MGAIGGILIADYSILRKCELSVDDLFDLNGQYRYEQGVNRRAMIALLLAIAPVVPGFVRAAMTPAVKSRTRASSIISIPTPGL